MHDTSPEMARRYFDLLRRRSGVERLTMADATTNLARAMAEAGTRSREPDLTARQVRAR